MLVELGRWVHCFGGNNQLLTELKFSMCAAMEVFFFWGGEGEVTYSVYPETLRMDCQLTVIPVSSSQEPKLTVYDPFKSGLQIAL